MKLWDVLAMCLLLLSSVATRPLYQNTQPAKRTYFPSSYSDSVPLPSLEDEAPSFEREDHRLQEISKENQCKYVFVRCVVCLEFVIRLYGCHIRDVLFVQSNVNVIICS